MTIGKGTALEYATTENGEYTALALVESCQIPENPISKIEVTDFDSEGPSLEYISGEWEDPGDLTATIKHDATQTVFLHTLKGAQKWWQVSLRDGSKYRFSGYISGIGVTIPDVKTLVKHPVTIAITGAVEFIPNS